MGTANSKAITVLFDRQGSFSVDASKSKNATYESDFVTPEEVYTGDWGLTANGEYSGVIMLDLTRTGGKRYTPGETERIIHDGFIVQVPMAFEDYTYLSVDKGQHGSYLPIQLEPDTVIYFYPQ